MGEGSMSGSMVISIKGNGETTKEMVKAFSPGLTDLAMKANGVKTNRTAKASTVGPIGIDMKVNSETIKRVVGEFFIGMTVEDTMGNG